jgi:ATP-dependent DNA helicase
VAERKQPSMINGVLRDYQLVGVDWLIGLYDNGLNGILADEMGLGKTLQTISFLAYLHDQNIKGPFLIVAPLSTLSNWKDEFIKFAPKIKICLYHGTPTERTELRKDLKIKNGQMKSSVIITSYELIMNDKKYLKKINWKYIVVDEGHRLKNMDCKLIKDLKTYTSANRLLLTGTPLQNNLKELWSLLNFLMPEIFNDLEVFEEWFETINEVSKDQESLRKSESDLRTGDGHTKMVNALHTILKPFLLRRIKIDVIKDLPKSIYI